MTQVLIVESPAKAKTINKYLGDDFLVLASFGHIRDLPSKEGSVAPDDDFAMHYDITARAEKQIQKIVQAVKGADTLYLATDPDREGESISWHLVEVLKQRRALRDQTKVLRVVFNEITKKAVQHAVANPRAVDMSLVNAQQARRALDYLVGFTLSPVLWRKLPGSRSAGRVQSVALRLICDREQEIEQFISQEYWDITLMMHHKGGQPLVKSMLTHWQGKKLDKFSLTDATTSQAIAQQLQQQPFSVISVEKKRVQRHPYAPFTTSSLQQEASRKLGFSAAKTMLVAQKLYEGVQLGGEVQGLITYMRTDGVQVSDEAITTARSVISQRFGSEYLPEKAKIYSSKAKNAQEAHEAIRPTNIALAPDHIRDQLDSDQARLYELIWKRMVASQMASAQYDQMIVQFQGDKVAAIARSTGSSLAFPGFIAVYTEGRDDEEEEEGAILPPFKEKESVEANQVLAKQHFTEPLPRYSEASLVKKLEELGIGRPSTYAAIISVLQEREYVVLEKKRFIPKEKGRLVTSFLSQFFQQYVEYDFTAQLENQLDEVSRGALDWKQLLKQFWQPFSTRCQEALKMSPQDVVEALNQALSHYLFPTAASDHKARSCPDCHEGTLGLKLGRFGAFLACSSYPSCKYTKQIVAPSAGEVGGEGDGADNADADLQERVLGQDPKTGQDVWLKKGPYGWYGQLGETVKGSKEKPKRAALPKELSPKNVRLEHLLGLLALPREVGVHPETGHMISASIGRFGPYLLHDGRFVSLPKDSGEDVLTIGLNRAVDVIADAEQKRGDKARQLEVITDFGTYPADSKTPLRLIKGKYGPYLKWGMRNVSIPKNLHDQTVLLSDIAPLLDEVIDQRKADRANSKGKKASSSKKSTAKKTATTKPRASKNKPEA